MDIDKALAEAIAQALGQSPGRKLLFVQLLFSDGSTWLVSVPPPPSSPPSPARQQDASACERDILQLLQGAGAALTTMQILSGLEAAGKLHGESTVKHTLARMVREGKLVNDPRARPPGYTLPGP